MAPELTYQQGLFTNCREEVFSETHFQLIERLCTEMPKTTLLTLNSYRRLPQDVGALDSYAGSNKLFGL
jgi:hypothetical protein